MKPLSIYDFVDYRAYLKTWLEYKKENARFSYADFAEKSGFQSRSFLRLIITNKRNISDSSLEKFIYGLDLNNNEAQGFRFLVKANQASNTDDRMKYWNLFLDHKPKSIKTQKIRNCFSYLSNFINPILKVLLSQKATAKWSKEQLAQFLNVSTQTISEALTNLKGLGFVNQNPDGEHIVTENIITTWDDIPDVAIQSFHKHALKKAIDGLELSVLEREFQAIIVGLNSDALLHLRKRLRQVADEIDQLYGEFQHGVDKIYICNLNLVPVTSSIIQEQQKFLSQNNDCHFEKGVTHEKKLCSSNKSKW
jgi:uncharacterized protein (TIGR02147 family)